MYRQRLAINLFDSRIMNENDQIRLLRRIGFDGFFTGFGSDVEALKQTAREEGMRYQSLHAPWGMCARMWEGEREDAERATGELISFVERSAAHEIPLMIAHTYVGFDHAPIITEAGLSRYGHVIDRAEELGVTIAFENTEGQEALDALLDTFGGRKSVGFCFDSGHEMCYNFSRDLLARHGKYLIATHLNDNLGIRDFDGQTTWIDDLHLLPFDGIANWKGIAARLDACGFDDILTFELGISSKPGRHENDGYREMPFERYLIEAYIRACRVAALKAVGP